MHLREVSAILQTKLSFIHSRVLLQRVMDTVVPFVSRNFVPEYMWLVEQFILRDYDTLGMVEENMPFCLSSTHSGALEMMRSSYGNTDGHKYNAFCWVLYRYPVNKAMSQQLIVISVFDSRGKEIQRGANESDQDWLWRAALLSVDKRCA